MTDKQPVERTRELIEQHSVVCKSHLARMKMSKLASGPLSRLTDEGKAMWAAYHAAGAPKNYKVPQV